MGGSEVGHLNIGAGRVVLQLMDKVNKTFRDTGFIQSPLWRETMQPALQNAPAIHLVGMYSDGGIHSHKDYIDALIPHVAGLGKPVYFHVITDGRDTPANAAAEQVESLVALSETLPNLQLADVTGRFYAMDRDQRTERTEAARALYTEGVAAHQAPNIQAAITAAYARDEGDEFITPTRLLPGTEGCINPGDVVIYLNTRADRMRQIVKVVSLVNHIRSFTMGRYDQTFDDKVTVLFRAELVPNTLGEIIAAAGLKQLRMAETEKYAHVTHFFSGGREDPFPGEERVLVPSPKVRTYDLQPEMSLPELSGKLVHALQQKSHDLLVVNFANGDMVGHCGNLQAAVKAVQAIDQALTQVIPAAADNGYDVLILADHGNCEEMSGNRRTSHSLNPVPLVYVGKRQAKLRSGVLADVAPTVLHVLDLPQHPAMTGTSLIKFTE
jgi:2,3-bisphosphoglycerate-independent phosphoglycerate mutase